MLNVLIEMASADYWQVFNRRAASSSPFFVASGVSRIIILRRTCEKPHKNREFEPTHVGCYVMIDELDAVLLQPGAAANSIHRCFQSRHHPTARCRPSSRPRPSSFVPRPRLFLRGRERGRPPARETFARPKPTGMSALHESRATDARRSADTLIHLQRDRRSRSGQAVPTPAIPYWGTIPAP